MLAFKFETHKYQPLPSKSSIRLLYPVRNDTNPCKPTICGQRLLQFKLEVADLKDPPKFQCLSYTNGDPIWSNKAGHRHRREYDTRHKWPIVVSGRFLFVTKNLHEALCQLHPLGKPTADIDVRGSYDATSLIKKAQDGDHVEVARLIEGGADMQATDRFGETALHYAAERGHLETAKVLLRAGADLNIVDQWGRRPIDCCLQSKSEKNEEIARLFNDLSAAQADEEDGIQYSSSVPTGDPFWIDSVCINGDDLDERNVQVAMMSDIYHAATRVVAWLGTDDADKAGTDRRRNALSDSVHSIRFRQAIDELMKQSYFHRLWTVQELAMAKEIAILFGSQELVSLNPLLLPYLALQAQIKRDSDQARVHGGGLRLWLDRNLSQAQQQIKEIVPDLELDLKVQPPEKIPWSTLLTMTWNHEVSDTRDKIFALFSLAEPLPSTPAFKVDYARSKFDIFLEMGRYFIAGDPDASEQQPAFTLADYSSKHRTWARRALRSGDIIGHPLPPFAGLSYKEDLNWIPNAHLSLPTWCPDFGRQLKRYPVDHTRFTAASTMPTVLNFSDDGRELYVEAAILYRITLWNRPPGNASITNNKSIIDDIGAWNYIGKAMKDTYPTGESSVTAFVRTIMMDLGRTKTGAREHAFPSTDIERGAFHHVKRLLKSHADMEQAESLRSHFPELQEAGREVEGEQEEFPPEIARLSHQRVFFRTQEAYVGWGGHGIRLYDKVCLLAGAHVPCILRPLDVDEPGPKKYCFVSDAYVHGLMYGEALRNGKSKFEPITIV